MPSSATVGKKVGIGGKLQEAYDAVAQRNDDENAFYTVLVFETAQENADFREAMRLDGDRYEDGRRFARRVVGWRKALEKLGSKDLTDGTEATEAQGQVATN